MEGDENSIRARLAARRSDAVALAAPGRAPMSYATLLDHVEHVGRQLNQLGIGRGDRVAIVLPNGAEMATAFLAVASVATAAPLNPNYRAPEFDFYLADLDAKALLVPAGSDSPAIAVAESRHIAVIHAHVRRDSEAGVFELDAATTDGADPEFARPDDIALVLHTSGTTSRPKLVPLSHHNLCTSADNIRSSLQLTRDDCCLNVMPLFHIHGLIAATLASLMAGASVACTPGFVATEFFNSLAEHQPTWYTAVPTMHQAILTRAQANRQVIDAANLRFIRSSSSALAPQVAEQLEQVFGVPVIEAYGMTEASHQMCSNPLPPTQRKFGSVGLPAGPQMAIMDQPGQLLSQGETGEVVIRGQNVFAGYENNEDANQQSFADGWFRTGDEGYFDADGYLYLTGRLKEIINRGGEKISPREVDEVLLAHPAVAQVVTFAMPDARLGEEIAAAVVLTEHAGTNEHDLMQFAAEHLADFKVPRRVLLLDEIPKGPTGKLQRIGLAEKLGLAGAADKTDGQTHAHVDPRDELEAAVATVCADVLKIDRVGVNDNFFELGGDSMLASLVIARVHEQLHRDLAMLVFFESPTVAGMAEALRTTPPADEADVQRLVCELEQMSDEQAQRLLEQEESGHNTEL